MCRSPWASRSTISAKEAMRPSLISSFDPSPGPWRWRRGEHPALGFHRWLCARGMNDALHGREARRRSGKRDRDRRREVGSRDNAHHGPGEATLTPVILVRIQVPQPVIRYLILHMLFSLQEAYFLANLRGLPVSRLKRFAAETVARAISAAAVMKISPAPFRG